MSTSPARKSARQRGEISCNRIKVRDAHSWKYHSRRIGDETFSTASSKDATVPHMLRDKEHLRWNIMQPLHDRLSIMTKLLN